MRITGPDGEKVGALARIDTGASSSSIDDDIAEELGFDLDDAETVTVASSLGREERPVVVGGLQLAGEGGLLAERAPLAFSAACVLVAGLASSYRGLRLLELVRFSPSPVARRPSDDHPLAAHHGPAPAAPTGPPRRPPAGHRAGDQRPQRAHRPRQPSPGHSRWSTTSTPPSSR